MLMLSRTAFLPRNSYVVCTTDSAEGKKDPKPEEWAKMSTAEGHDQEVPFEYLLFLVLRW